MIARRGRLPTVVFLGLVVLATELDAQARGATRRNTAAPGQAGQVTDGQGRMLLDRFAERAGRSLRLSADQIRRLQSELQTSRETRTRLTAQARAVRQELARLVRESSSNETRLHELVDEFMQLQVDIAAIDQDEQRRLAEFLTPTQRVRVFWLRQRAMQEARDRLQNNRARDSLPVGDALDLGL